VGPPSPTVDQDKQKLSVGNMAGPKQEGAGEDITRTEDTSFVRNA